MLFFIEKRKKEKFMVSSVNYGRTTNPYFYGVQILYFFYGVLTAVGAVWEVCLWGAPRKQHFFPTSISCTLDSPHNVM